MIIGGILSRFFFKKKCLFVHCKIPIQDGTYSHFSSGVALQLLSQSCLTTRPSGTSVSFQWWASWVCLVVEILQLATGSLTRSLMLCFDNAEWYRDGPANHCWRLHRLLFFRARWQELQVYLPWTADSSQSKLVIHFLRQWASLRFEESINQMRLHWDLKKVLDSGYFLKRQSEPNLIGEQ